MARRFACLIAASAMAMTMLTGCATLPEDPEERAEAEALNDPLEPTNRALFQFNMYLDENLMEPVAEGYRDTFPDWFREAIHNFLVNLQEPYVAGNDLLQGNPRAAADALGRFMINSTFGMLGFRDAVAESGGPKPHKTDIGTTFGVWGFDEGPYLMLPFFGPSNMRDGAGRVADTFASPTGSVMASQGLGVFNTVQTGVDILDTRTQYLDPIKELRRTSLDEYAAIRSLYRQTREAAIAASRRGQQAHATAPAAEAAKPGPASATPEPSAGDGAGTDPNVRPSAVEFVQPKP